MDKKIAFSSCCFAFCMAAGIYLFFRSHANPAYVPCKVDLIERLQGTTWISKTGRMVKVVVFAKNEHGVNTFHFARIDTVGSTSEIVKAMVSCQENDAYFRLFNIDKVRGEMTLGEEDNDGHVRFTMDLGDSLRIRDNETMAGSYVRTENRHRHTNLPTLQD